MFSIFTWFTHPSVYLFFFTTTPDTLWAYPSLSPLLENAESQAAKPWKILRNQYVRSNNCGIHWHWGTFRFVSCVITLPSTSIARDGGCAAEIFGAWSSWSGNCFHTQPSYVSFSWNNLNHSVVPPTTIDVEEYTMPNSKHVCWRS